MNYYNDIKEYIELEKAILDKLDIAAIDRAMQLIEKTYHKERNIYIFGNGGSSATAMHYQNDFNKGLSETLQKKFNFVSISNDVATLTAIANDIGFDEVFRYQLKGKLKKGDILIAISGSGNSKNVINAVEYAKEQGNLIIGLTGYDGGKLKSICDISLHVSVNSMQISEDIHMIFDHLIMSVFYKHLCGKNHLK